MAMKFNVVWRIHLHRYRIIYVFLKTQLTEKRWRKAAKITKVDAIQDENVI